MLKRGRIGWLSYSQVDIPVSVLPKSTNLSTTASAVVALCVSKRALDPASSVEAWYIHVLNSSFLFLYFNVLVVLTFLFVWFSLHCFFLIDAGLHKRGAGDPAARLQQKPKTEKEAYGR